MFGWDGDHLHVFEVGKKRYGDPFVNLEGTGDEEAVRIQDAVAPGGTIAYTYDLGTCWEHEITLERRSRAITARNTRSAWRSGAIPRWSTGRKRNPRNPDRSA